MGLSLSDSSVTLSKARLRRSEMHVVGGGPHVELASWQAWQMRGRMTHFHMVG